MTHPASIRQRQAADPAASTWLSANAGSGKTKVLTDRVARLLLAGVAPQRILCLTYTKAAAAEMQNRLFRRLGAWAMMPQDDLLAALADLGIDHAPDAATLAAARRLFARAIETPGGLKIQTIHSFCAALMRRFPLEAQVAPGFTEMDERSAELLQAEVIEDLAERLAPDTITRLARHYTGEDFLGLAANVARQRSHFTPAARAALPDLLGVRPGDDMARILTDVFTSEEREWLLALVAALARGGGVTDGRAAVKLGRLNLDHPGPADLEILEDVLLTGPGAKEPFAPKIGSFPTKGLRATLDTINPLLEDLMQRVADARGRRLAVQALERAMALHDFAGHFLPEYARRKQARGWLDFDDLILRARDLLSVSSVAQWVLYRLDGGIDHILVDEAQDTSPEQWQVIELLTQEFTAGHGAREAARTIFVVGDKKQSIYSFQGADLARFDAMQNHFATRLGAMGTGLQQLPLEYSFRSAPAVLQAVDAVCAPFAAMGPVLHRAFRDTMPGRVDLWPALTAGEEPDPGDWFDPVDLPSPQAPETMLAETIATHIRDLLAAGTQIPTPDGPRPLRAGDVLVLVQRRGALFHEVIRACKAAGLPIAGADRLKLGAEVAVKDLAALLAFLATPEDDLALATALRSPLFGWDEGALYDLAHGRKGWLWQELRNRTDHEATREILHDLRDRVDFQRPFELVERILTRHDGRRRLIARLGPEAEDGIDQFLSQALAYERLEVPSLTGFLTWLQTDDVEVKRQADAAGDRIGVMTVHGAKGLEAPVVILPDTAERRAPGGDEVVMLAGDIPAWGAARHGSTPAQEVARERIRARWAEENQRLLYVAMTRAESWLIAAAAGKVARPDCWHAAITAGLESAGATGIDTPTGPGLRLAGGDWPAAAISAEPLASVAAPTLPDWTQRPAPTVERPPAPLTPTGLGGAKVLPGDAGLPADQAMARGTALHLLLERLPEHPPDEWDALAATIPDMAPDILAEARRILTAPELAFLFAPDTLAEVEFSADLAGRPLRGVIDRLVIGPDRVLAVDFKSNAIIPDDAAATPDGILRQMGAYAAALAQIWPDKVVETAILWTAAPRLMPLPPALITVALARTDEPAAAP